MTKATILSQIKACLPECGSLNFSSPVVIEARGMRVTSLTTEDGEILASGSQLVTDGNGFDLSRPLRAFTLGQLRELLSGIPAPEGVVKKVADVVLKVAAIDSPSASGWRTRMKGFDILSRPVDFGCEEIIVNLSDASVTFKQRPNRTAIALIAKPTPEQMAIIDALCQSGIAER